MKCQKITVCVAIVIIYSGYMYLRDDILNHRNYLTFQHVTMHLYIYGPLQNAIFTPKIPYFVTVKYPTNRKYVIYCQYITIVPPYYDKNNINIILSMFHCIKRLLFNDFHVKIKNFQQFLKKLTFCDDVTE